MKRTQSGFTLTELMIVVAIIGILAAIAIPSYQDSVTKSRRADAKGALMGLANAMERHFTEKNNYCNSGGAGGTGTNACGDVDLTNDTGSPTIYSTQSPVDGTTKYYDLTIDTVTPSTYIITAVPTGAQSNDKCGTLTLNHAGIRSITGEATGVQVADCW